MKVKYILDKEYDALYIWHMLRSDDPAGSRYRAQRMGITEEQLNKIYGKKSYIEVKSYIQKIVNKRYSKYDGIINKALESNQRSWDEINEFFSIEIEKITKHKWKFDEYVVVISPFHQGISNRDNNKVIRWAFEDPIEQRRITAHEILMIHIWDILDKEYTDYYRKRSDENKMLHLWALNEITTNAILGLEKSLDKLWSSSTKGYDNYLLGYLQISSLKSELKELYIKKSSFKDYLDKAIALLKSKYANNSFAYKS